MDNGYEPMADFFNLRAGSYEEHMKSVLSDLNAFYEAAGSCINPTGEAVNILDLGTGTGMQLESVFAKAPRARVTAIDVSEGMLEKNRERFAGRGFLIEYRQSSFLDYEFGTGSFDYIISTEAMHHFTPAEKSLLYKLIARSLKPGGSYIEADYLSPAESDYKKALEAYNSVPDSARGRYHIDIPLPLDKHIELIGMAFKSVEVVYTQGNHIVVKCC